ncbi:MAG: DUF2007 domain-containing protein [Bacteroidales bacterium]|nr:DUF2007 domain-containing protein [Bacteroidales bacterium]
MKTVKQYTDSFSANLAKGLLENAGIKAAILGENTNVWAGVYNTDLLTLELVVSDEDYSEACKLIEAASSAE